MEDTYYFSHDYNARTDVKIRKLMRLHKCAGYGVYWSIVEDLYNNANVLPLDYESIAFELREDESLVRSVINDFDLFVINGDVFGSMSVKKRLDLRNKKSKKAADAANKRWDTYRKNANTMQTHSDSNAIKERKGNEIKDINKEKDDFYIGDLDFTDDKPTEMDIYLEQQEEKFANLDESFKEALRVNIGIERPYVWCNRQSPQEYFDLVDCIIRIREDVEWRSTFQRNNNVSKEKLLSGLYEFVKKIISSQEYLGFDGYNSADGQNNFIKYFSNWFVKQGK